MQASNCLCGSATVPFIKGRGLGAFIRKHDLAWHISFSPVAAMQQASLVNIGNIETQTGRMAVRKSIIKLEEKSYVWTRPEKSSGGEGLRPPPKGVL